MLIPTPIVTNSPWKKQEVKKVKDNIIKPEIWQGNQLPGKENQRENKKWCRIKQRSIKKQQSLFKQNAFYS